MSEDQFVCIYSESLYNKSYCILFKLISKPCISGICLHFWIHVELFDDGSEFDRGISTGLDIQRDYKTTR